MLCCAGSTLVEVVEETQELVAEGPVGHQADGAGQVALQARACPCVASSRAHTNDGRHGTGPGGVEAWRWSDDSGQKVVDRDREG